MADFLLGRPSLLSFYREQENQSNYFLEGFAQNDYRVATRLTLNLGVRYYYEQPVYQVDGFKGTLSRVSARRSFPTRLSALPTMAIPERQECNDRPG